jgi:hypothetical protein
MKTTLETITTAQLTSVTGGFDLGSLFGGGGGSGGDKGGGGGKSGGGKKQSSGGGDAGGGITGGLVKSFGLGKAFGF